MDGSDLQELAPLSSQGFSIANDGTIAYVNHDYDTLDNTHGVVWLMNADGSNKHQLTYNLLKQ